MAWDLQGSKSTYPWQYIKIIHIHDKKVLTWRVKTDNIIIEGNTKETIPMKQEILDLIEEKNIDLAELNDAYELEEELNHDGSIDDLIDSNIDIYNYDLRKWAVDNYEYIEDAIAEGLVDTDDFDFHKAIQSGQYLKLP